MSNPMPHSWQNRSSGGYCGLRAVLVQRSGSRAETIGRWPHRRPIESGQRQEGVTGLDVAGGRRRTTVKPAAADAGAKEQRPAAALGAARAADSLDSHLWGARTLTLPGRIDPAMRESVWKKSVSESSHDGP